MPMTVTDKYGNVQTAVKDTSGNTVVLKNQASPFGSSKFLIGAGVAIVALMLFGSLVYEEAR